MPQQVIFTYGLPASGKSTWAKEFVKNNPNFKRVNRDDLRKMVDNSVYSKENESTIVSLRNTAIATFLERGHSVIVDDTNIQTKNMLDIFHNVLPRFPRVEFSVQEFNTPVDTCIERDSQRENSVSENVIRSMAQQQLTAKSVDEVRSLMKFIQDFTTRLSESAATFRNSQGNEHMQPAIIVDVDGTIAERHEGEGGRSPFDWSRVGEDTPREAIIEIVNQFFNNGYAIIVLSGRDGSCFEETTSWLLNHGVLHHHLFMRPTGDMRKDYIVKSEIYSTLIAPLYRVDFALDDRDQVVHMWRNHHNIQVLQVNYGNF